MKTILCMLLVAATACASVPENVRVQREIQAEYRKLDAAFERRDVHGVLSFRTPDFFVHGPQGERQTFEQMAEYTRNWLLVQNKPPIDVSVTVDSVELLPDGAVAAKVTQRASRYQDREGKRVHVRHVVQQRETWVRTANGWKIRTVDQIDLANRKRWIDGVLEQKQ
jgi:ketosteroid isomerase-like protein